MKNSVVSVEKILEQWQNLTLEFLPRVALAVLTLFCFVFLARLAKYLSLRSLAKFRSTELSGAFVKVLSAGISLFFLLSGLFIALQILGLEAVLTKLLAGAGVVGIIAGFAFKDIASNAFAGLLLDLQRPFEKGDWVQIDSNYGTVFEIGWLTTSLDTVVGQRVYVPNQLIYNTAFTNYSIFKRRRVVLESGVSYGDDLELVRTQALEAVKSVEGLLAHEKVDFYFTEIGGSTYNFQLRFWIEFHSNDDYQRAMNDVIMKVKQRFEEHDISIAYPVTTLDFGVKGGVNLFDESVKVEQPGQRPLE